MKSRNIVELSPNDGWQTAAMKINSNFSRLYTLLSSDGDIKISQMSGSVNDQILSIENTLEQTINDLKEDLNETFRTINTSIDSLKDQVESQRKMIDSLKMETVPPVGTCIICSYDPNKTYKDTTWVKIGTTEYESNSIWKRTK